MESVNPDEEAPLIIMTETLLSDGNKNKPLRDNPGGFCFLILAA